MQSSNIEIPLIISVSRGKSPGEVLLIAWLYHLYLFKMFYNRAIILISRQWASDENRVYLAMLNYRKYITLGNQIITTFKPYGILETIFLVHYFILLAHLYQICHVSVTLPVTRCTSHSCGRKVKQFEVDDHLYIFYIGVWHLCVPCMIMEIFWLNWQKVN